MKSILKLACCILAGSTLGMPAWAQLLAPTQSASATQPLSGATTVTLSAASDAAWQRAVSARETHGQQQRAEAERVAASSFWAAPPSFELKHRDDRWQTNAGSRETEAGLAWPLWLPGQRDARGAAADTGIALADQAQRAARLRIAGEVRESAWDLISRMAELEEADALVLALKTLTTDVDRRVKAGYLARADALVAQAEALSATAQQTEARQRVFASRSRWNLLTGLDALPTADEPPVTLPLTDTLSTHPEMRFATLAAEHARKRAELARVSRSSPPELTFGVRQDIPGRSEPSQNSVSLGIRIPFGTADRNQPLQAAALSELDVAETVEKRQRDRILTEISAARAALQANEQQLLAERSRKDLLRERATLIEKSFRSGESPLPDLLRAMAAAAQADAALSRQRAALGLAHARLQQSLGILP